VRKDAYQGQPVEEGVIFQLVESPARLMEGTVVKFTKGTPPAGVAIEFQYNSLDGRTLKLGLQIHRKATLEEIWPEIQTKAGEQLEEVRHFVPMKGRSIALLPWEDRQTCDLIPVHEIAQTSTCTGTFGLLSVTVPKFRKDAWAGIIIQELSQHIVAFTESGPRVYAVGSALELRGEADGNRSRTEISTGIRSRGSFCPSRVPGFLLFNRIKDSR
jgi:hypothetical protein